MRKEAVYYRKTDIKKFEDFKEGDCICEVCNGWGYFYDCEDNRVSSCYHCNGIGKLDWITNVTGVAGRSGTIGGAGLMGSASTSGAGVVPSQQAVKQYIDKIDKINMKQFPKIETTPYKASKKISLKQKILNAVVK